jgi:hypothetical protein
MAATQQSQAIANANAVMNLGASLLQLYAAITAVNNAWNDDSSLTVLQAMGTTALNTDGTPGAADGTPNPAHPLNTATYPTLTRAIAANDLGSILTQLNAVVGFVNGSQAGPTAGVRSVLNKAVGG